MLRNAAKKRLAAIFKAKAKYFRDVISWGFEGHSSKHSLEIVQGSHIKGNKYF